MITQLPDDVRRYLAPQERFERLRRDAVLRSGRGLCDLSYANAYDGPSPEVRDAIRQPLAEARPLDLQYTPYGGATVTRRLVAGSLGRTHRISFHWRDVVMTPGAMAALNLLFRMLKTGEWADEVIVVTPCWFDYPLYLSNLHMRPVFVAVHPSSLRLDLEGIKQALTPRTRALVLSHPANPTGILYSPDELRQLADLLASAKQEILLISDECHREVLYGDASFVSPCEYYEATCVVYSFGKSLFMQGQRIGYVAVAPKMPDRNAVRLRLEQLCRIMGYCTPTALMQAAIGHLLKLQPDLSRVTRRRDLLISKLREYGYSLAPSQATFFLYPRSPVADDFAFAEHLSRQGVMVLPSALFHHRGHFRISVTATDDMLERALPILHDAAEDYRAVAAEAG